MKVWILSIHGYDALEDPWTLTGAYGSEREALDAFTAWLDEHSQGQALPDEGGEPFTREKLEHYAKDYFDSFEPKCGPACWTLHEVELNAPMPE